MWVMARARPVQLFQADSDLLITTFCHYFSLNLTLKASIILLQRKTISNTSHTKQIQGVHKVRVHFKKFITLFLFVIEIICKNV